MDVAATAPPQKQMCEGEFSSDLGAKDCDFVAAVVLFFTFWAMVLTCGFTSHGKLWLAGRGSSLPQIVARPAQNKRIERVDRDGFT